MGKNYFFYNVLFLVFMFSCNREDFTEQTDMIQSNSIIGKSIRPLNITPYYSMYNYLGSGYNVTKEFANENSVGSLILDLDKFNNDYGIRKEYVLSQEYKEYYGENAIEYIKNITKSTNLNLTFNATGFGGSLSSSFSRSTTFDHKFDANTYMVVIVLLLNRIGLDSIKR